MTISWEPQVAALLRDLSTVQEELLALLGQKRAILAAGDAAALSTLQPKEAELIGRLEACQQQRAALLAQAAADGKPAASIRELTKQLPKSERAVLEKQVEAAASRARLLEHQSLANWVAVQRTLLHLSQMLEIIATGGRAKPTYEKGDAAALASGALVDQAA